MMLVVSSTFIAAHFLLMLLYNPQHWSFYPSMAEIRCIATSNRQLFVAVPSGVYIFDRTNLRHIRTIASPDGIEGAVRLCAAGPGRNSLLIATEAHLYEFLLNTGGLHQLDPPFRDVKSVGVGPDGFYFDTGKELYKKPPVASIFTRVQSVPGNIIWFGERDTSKPRDYIFLNPYFIMDDQLNNRPMTLVRPDPTGKRFYVAVQDYGLFVYNRAGFAEHHLRYGPAGNEVRKIVGFNNRVWFVSSFQTAAVDQNGNWTYSATGPGDLTGGSSFILSKSLLDLDRREHISAILPLSGSVILGTGSGLHLLNLQGKLSLIVATNHRVNGLTWLRDTILVGTDMGLFLWANDTLTLVSDPFGRTDWGVFDISRNRTGTIFFGTLGGILKLDSTGTWSHLVPPGFDLSRPVRTVAASQDFLFLGSESGLIVYSLKDKNWTTIDKAQGLPSTNITALYADDRYLWIAAPGIVSRFDYRAGLR
ncbi:MAG: hypothetical protein ABIK44_00775 [candidate division WOR-3 bacterium]